MPPAQRLVQSGFYEVALTPAFEASLCHATSQNPQDSRIDRGMIQDGKLRGFAMGQAIPNANGQIRPSTKHSDYPRCW
jgi:hypothetical protein